jgi:hypothetical protein
VRILDGALGGGQGVLVAAEAVVKDRDGPVVGPEPEPFAAAQHVEPLRLDQRHGLGVPAAPPRERNRSAEAEVAARGLDDGLRLGRHRRRDVDPPGEQLHGDRSSRATGNSAKAPARRASST